MNCQAQRFDRGVPAVVLKPELTFEKQARPDSEFHTVRLHSTTPGQEIMLRIVRQPLAEAKPESLPRVPPLLQFRVLRLGFFQDGDVGVGDFRGILARPTAWTLAGAQHRNQCGLEP